jgi:transcriptional regulator with XRE-family HTH domain
MDDRRIGAVFRALRQRKAWRQVDLATRARVSPTVIGRIERGSFETIPLGKLRRVAESVGARFEATIRWSGADLGRLLDARLAAMHEAIASLLASLDGWECEPEVSFSIYGERGIIDVLAWHPGRRALLVIELKTEIVDVSDLLGSMDRRRRLGRQIARSRRWDPVEVSTWVVVAESRTNRRAVSSHARVLRSKLPVDGRGIARWLRDPVGRVDALSFLPDRHPVALGRPTAPIRRVSSRSQRPSRA